MKTKLIFYVLICLFVNSIFSQSNLNNYKYVIVPKKFDFLKEENQYRLNGLAKFLFEKYGFESIMEGEGYPEDMFANRCLALKSDVIKDSGLFKTKLNIVLKDCNDRVVYTSQVGESREKEFAKAYNDALRKAFESFESVNYSYSPDTSVVATTTSVEPKAETKAVTKEIEALKAEIQSLKEEKQEKATETKQDVPEVVAVKKPVVTKKQVVEVQEAPKSMLYAQAIENGFQLVDSSPKVIYKIVETGVNNVFLVEGISAIIYKEGNEWVIEQLAGSTPIKEILDIKF
ncbi:hypothetical protein [Aestuariivivens marinum]|uniref:hypothetical protein n=1 Tax=Aestuariivivens marinum TaxID=2913555 RepID=UPI001F594C56|nr:hypothetical protein [Aestuariivivens marinum]